MWLRHEKEIDVKKLGRMQVLGEPVVAHLFRHTGTKDMKRRDEVWALINDMIPALAAAGADLDVRMNLFTARSLLC